ncbi:MAG: flippase [Paludibacteraceae bacterium]|nr:flippase [Paludibacteraceae bacterium]
MFHFLRQIYSSFKRSKDAKTVFANFGYLSFLQIAGYAFPLITMPYLARVIGVEGFGKVSFAAAIIVWIQTIADWGFNLTATRDVAQNRENKIVVSQIFSNVFWARCILTFLSGCILFLLVLFVPLFRNNFLVIFTTFLMVPGHILFPEWFFQAIEKMKYTTIFNLILKFLFTISVFLFIKEKHDYYIQPLLTSLGYVCCGICALYLILHKWGFRIYKPQWDSIFTTIKQSTDIFINSLMPNLYNSFSVLLLGFWGGSSANGIYDGGNKFPTIFYNLQSVLSRAFYPFLSRRQDKHCLFAKISIGSAVTGAILLVILSPIIIKYMLGEEFEKSVIVMQILSFSTIFLALSYTYGTNKLIIQHKEKPLRNLTFFSSIIGMCIAIPLVYFYSYIGAAITVIISRGFLGIGAYWLSKKYNN